MPPIKTVYVGIDIGKESLDVAAADLRLKVANNRDGFGELLRETRALKKRLHFIVESDESYGRELARFLHARKCKMSVVPPYRVRSYARATGRLAKTDYIDSELLAEYGREFRPGVTGKADKIQAQLQHIMRRRRQVVDLLKIQKTQIQQMWDREIMADTKKLMQQFEERIEALTTRAEALVKASPALAAKFRAYCKVVGIGGKTAIELIAEMPELGTLGRKQVAALAGLAPVNYDSGTTPAPRHIRGGRFYVRTSLYMPTLVAVKHNEVLKVFYDRLRANGKPFRVALTAAMRKMVIYLNHVARDATVAQ